MKTKKKYRKKSRTSKQRKLNNPSLFAIFTGSVLLTIGFVVGDLHINNNFIISKIFLFLVGFLLQSITIVFFIRTKLLNTPR